MRKTNEGQKSVERHYHKVFAHVTDSVGNVAVLQSYNRIGHETEALRNHVRALLSAQNPVLDWWALASALHRLASTISMMVVLMIGALLVSRGELRIGDIVAFTGFATLLISRLDQISSFRQPDLRRAGEARGLLPARGRFRRRRAGAGRAARTRPRDRPCPLRECQLSSSPNSGQGVADVSFEVKAGQTVAIVGPTGAGKTTLINLLAAGAYAAARPHPDRRRRHRARVTRKSLRQSIATVFQDAGLFNRSIEENIRIGRAGAVNNEVHAAAEAAAAHDFILSKSEGYDTPAGERGSQLSGGERQRIAIARAILKDAPILVLDEATSALDVETEARVKEAIDRLRAGPHHLHHRPPPDHRARRRSRRLPRQWPHRRDGRLRRAVGPQWPLCLAAAGRRPAHRRGSAARFSRIAVEEAA